MELIDEVRKELDNNPVLTDDEPDARGKDERARERSEPDQRFGGGQPGDGESHAGGRLGEIPGK